MVDSRKGSALNLSIFLKPMGWLRLQPIGIVGGLAPYLRLMMGFRHNPHRLCKPGALERWPRSFWRGLRMEISANYGNSSYPEIITLVTRSHLERTYAISSESADLNLGLLGVFNFPVQPGGSKLGMDGLAGTIPLERTISNRS
jgi:hypothetical protein